jgi:hypothetical protein
MSDRTILSTSDAFTRTQRCAVDVLLAVWTIRPEGEDVDDLDDVLGLHLERAVYEEIAKGLAEVARLPHEQMRDHLRLAAQQELHRGATPGYRWATTTEIPAGIPAAATWRRTCWTPISSRCCNACLWPSSRGFHAAAHRSLQGRPHRHGPTRTIATTDIGLHVLVVETKHDVTVTVHWTNEDARAALVSFVEQAWEPMLADEPMPTDPSVAIQRYFSGVSDNSYLLYSTTISSPTAP